MGTGRRAAAYGRGGECVQSARNGHSPAGQFNCQEAVRSRQGEWVQPPITGHPLMNPLDRQGTPGRGVGYLELSLMKRHSPPQPIQAGPGQ